MSAFSLLQFSGISPFPDQFDSVSRPTVSSILCFTDEAGLETEMLNGKSRFVLAVLHPIRTQRFILLERNNLLNGSPLLICLSKSVLKYVCAFLKV